MKDSKLCNKMMYNSQFYGGRKTLYIIPRDDLQREYLSVFSSTDFLFKTLCMRIEIQVQVFLKH